MFYYTENEKRYSKKTNREDAKQKLKHKIAIK